MRRSYQWMTRTVLDGCHSMLTVVYHSRIDDKTGIDLKIKKL